MTVVMMTVEDPEGPPRIFDYKQRWNGHCREAMSLTIELPKIVETVSKSQAPLAELSGDIAGVFLLADDALIDSRVRSSGFSAGANNREAMLCNYLKRSIWYSAERKDEVSRLGLATVQVTEDTKSDEIADECIRVLGKGGP